MNRPENRGGSGRFAPGTSGNPGGRPKDEHGIAKLARSHAPEAMERLVTLMRSKDERISLNACSALLDRGYGKPTQPLDHEVRADARPVKEIPTDELNAMVMPKARAVVRRLVGDKIESMTETEIVEMALPVFAALEAEEKARG